MSDIPKYPYGATGYDPATGKYTWDEPAEQPPENGTEDNEDEEDPDEENDQP